MAAPSHSPAASRAAPGHTPPTPALDLETRLALTDAAMTLRLEETLLRVGIDTAHAETVLSTDDFTTEALAAYTATAPRPAPDLYPTPVAAHGDIAGWSAVDFEVYEHLVEAERADQLDTVLSEHHVVDGPAPAAA